MLCVATTGEMALQELHSKIEQTFSVCGQTARPQTEDVMAWRDDKARATLIREAAGSMQPGKAPRAFAERLFDHTNIEDLVNYDAASLAFLAEQASVHGQRRTAGMAAFPLTHPAKPDRP